MYARYIRHFLPRKAKGKLDYAIVTHYHIDHFSAIAELCEEIPFRTLVDRSWPDYSDERYVAKSNMDFYTSFVKRFPACVRKKMLRFEPGRNDQIVLRHKPRGYPNFRVKNYAAGGIVWDGEKCIDPYEGKQVKENGASCCFLLSYGDFDYYTGGDAGGDVQDVHLVPDAADELERLVEVHLLRVILLGGDAVLDDEVLADGGAHRVEHLAGEATFQP